MPSSTCICTVNDRVLLHHYCIAPIAYSSASCIRTPIDARQPCGRMVACNVGPHDITRILESNIVILIRCCYGRKGCYVDAFI
ncbi:hypothetical protein BDR07DRAFT_429387 [Suillus spraguei]|nr:hypothetical protein BDR07DRAFT_429387 [Suillus spraguei]